MNQMPNWLGGVLATIPVAQGIAAGLKSITSHFDPDYKKRLWYRFWNALASFPGSNNQ